MPYITHNCDALIGGAARALDSYSVGVLTTGDRAFVDEAGETLRFKYNSAGTAVENVSTHPYVVRPDDYSAGGNWEEQETVGGVSAAANLTAEALAVGADGAKGIKALALGAANLKLFMNAAGSANEYANGTFIGTITYDTATASGDQAITGVGFKPSRILLLTCVDSTSQVSVGLDDGTNHYCIINYNAVAAGQWTIRTAYSIELQQSVGVLSGGIVSALGADGFTITWTKTGAKTGKAYIHYIAFR